MIVIININVKLLLSDIIGPRGGDIKRRLLTKRVSKTILKKIYISNLPNKTITNKNLS